MQEAVLFDQGAGFFRGVEEILQERDRVGRRMGGVRELHPYFRSTEAHYLALHGEKKCRIDIYAGLELLPVFETEVHLGAKAEPELGNIAHIDPHHPERFRNHKEEIEAFLDDGAAGAASLFTGFFFWLLCIHRAPRLMGSPARVPERWLLVQGPQRACLQEVWSLLVAWLRRA